MVMQRPVMVPLPEKFGQVFGFWLKDRARGEFVFARAPGQKPVSAQAARAYLRGMLKQAGIDGRSARTSCGTPTPPTCSTPGPSGWTSRPCSATRACASAQIYTNGRGQARMEQVVARL